MRIELEDILKFFPKRIQDSHKGTYGRILNIAGSKFYSGAAILSSLSALKVGAGYVTLACPCDICNNISAYSPDITLLPTKSTNGCISNKNIDFLLNKSKEYDIVSIGSGLSQNTETQKFIIEFLREIKKPCVIDADAINAVSKNRNYQLPKNSIITPHPKELSRLINISVEDIQKSREKFAIETANKNECIVVLKGHKTIVTDGSKIYENNSGNSALSKAGSGDVLTGMITGILAQKNNHQELFESASLGVYLHGLAGEEGAKEKTEYGLLASELLKYIPKAIKQII